MLCALAAASRGHPAHAVAPRRWQDDAGCKRSRARMRSTNALMHASYAPLTGWQCLALHLLVLPPTTVSQRANLSFHPIRGCRSRFFTMFPVTSMINLPLEYAHNTASPQKKSINGKTLFRQTRFEFYQNVVM
jgi:hypothetical protein